MGTVTKQKGLAVVKRVLLLGVGAAIGWYGHSKLSKGRDEAALRAEQAFRTSLAPENIGRTIGEGAATVIVESVRGFVVTVREQIPALNRHQPSLPVVEHVDEVQPLRGEVSEMTAKAAE